jgi:hypothetical protein
MFRKKIRGSENRENIFNLGNEYRGNLIKMLKHVKIILLNITVQKSDPTSFSLYFNYFIFKKSN